MGLRRFSNWRERICWLVLAFSFALIFVPRSLRIIIASPLQTVLLAPLRGTAWVRQRVADLSAENSRLSQLATELAIENAHLKTVCRATELKGTGFTDQLPLQAIRTISAPIISRDLSTFERFFIVSRGGNHGIRPGCPVLAPTGVVGKVIATSPHQSLVQTFLDPDCPIAVVDMRSRAPALTRPDRHRLLKLDYVPKDADIAVGDTIVTSGLGGIFPRGLRVGIVTEIPDRATELFKTVRVRPFVDVTRLEQVFLLCIADSLPPSLSDGWLDNLRPLELKTPGESGR